MKVAIMEGLGISAQELAQRKKPFEDKGVVFEEFQRTTDTAKLIEQAKGAETMILANMPMPAEVIRACPELKFIDIAFTGVDHVGLDAAKERGIAVSNASGYSNEAVAELVLGMVLSMARNLRQVEDRCRTGGTKDGLVGSLLCGKTVGIVGAGAIGRKVAALCKAFGCTVLAYNRSAVSDPAIDEQVSLDALLKRADIVSLHCPLTADTKGMIGKGQLALMKNSALLINTARGGVLDSQALAEALENGEIAGAACDVFETEPPLPADHPLLRCPNIIVTPHTAFSSVESMEQRADIVFNNLYSWLDGKQVNAV